MNKLFLVLLAFSSCSMHEISIDSDIIEPVAPTPSPDIPGPSPTPHEKNLIYINSDSEYDSIPNKEDVVLYFFATWCGPCQQQAPIYEELARNNKSVMFYKIDVDKCRSSAQNKGVRGIPCIFVAGEKLVGFQSKETLQQYVDRLK